MSHNVAILTKHQGEIIDRLAQNYWYKNVAAEFGVNTDAIQYFAKKHKKKIAERRQIIIDKQEEEGLRNAVKNIRDIQLTADGEANFTKEQTDLKRWLYEMSKGKASQKVEHSGNISHKHNLDFTDEEIREKARQIARLDD